MKNRPSEFELIARYFAPLAGEGAFGLVDDAALLDVPAGKKLVVTQDALAAGVHFFADDLPRLIAKKALRVNLSDLAAKGAKPLAYSLALGLPQDWRESWIKAFAKGLEEDQAGFGLTLTGGDTYRSPGGITISITAFGLVDAGKYISRMGARPGDVLFVTGTIGDAALGLKQIMGEIDSRLLAKHEKTYLRERYMLPQPGTLLAEIIGEYASASMDISDGLVGDLEKLCKASGVGAKIDAPNVPFSAPVRKIIQALPQHLHTALTGGDDYELLLAVNPQKFDDFHNAIQLLPITITKIGVVEDMQNGVCVVDDAGNLLTFENTSFRHF